MSQEPEFEPSFFTADEVNLIKSLAHDAIKQVFYHYWVNGTGNDSFKVLDYIQLVKESNESIFITLHNETGELSLTNSFDAEAKKAELATEFGGQIQWEIKDVSHTKMWKPNIGKEITVSLIRIDQQTSSESIGLKFAGADNLEIFPSMLDGLEVDYLEG
jgi:hypothetical protein